MSPIVKKIALGVALVFLLGIVGFFWARSVFANDAVRGALAAQLSAAIGQPVAISSITAGFYPRLTVKLGGVSIGEPARIHAETLRLGTDVRALLWREIVHGSIELQGARLELPLPALGSSSTSNAPNGSAEWPVTIVSIDEIVLEDVEIVSGGRSLRGDIDVVPHDKALTLRRVALAADDTAITATGELTDLAGPKGAVTLEAGTLNLDRLLSFLTDFSRNTGLRAPSGARRPAAAGASGAGPDLTITLNANRATMGALSLEKLTGKAHVTADGVVINPIAFSVLGGGYNGSLEVGLADALTIRWRAAVSDLDVAAAMAFAGSPGVMTGRLSGRLDLTTVSGVDGSQAVDNARGAARVDIANGMVKNLGLVRTVVLATAMRSDTASAPTNQPADERFTKLGATLTIGGGAARTSDLLFESPDVTMSAGGLVRLNGSAINLKGDLQLSEALSAQAGRDLVRYTQQQGRVTVPVTVTGSIQSPVVRIDMAQLAGRALRNRVEDDVKKAIDRLFKK